MRKLHQGLCFHRPLEQALAYALLSVCEGTDQGEEDRNGISQETRMALLNKFFQSGNKLKTNNPFQTLEDSIITEMRRDLQTDSF